MRDLSAAIRTIPDFPAPGIQFRDITTLLLDGAAFGACIEQLAAVVGEDFNLVAGIEARGFVFAAALAHSLGKGVLLLRKRNKLPGATLGVNYALEYGQDRIEMHADAVAPGTRVLLVDDLIATGGTAKAGAALIRQAGGVVVRAAFVIDLPDLGGADALRADGVEVVALVAFAGH
ncbi:adenine phosphoribosyltransferase [Sandaracinobacteroides saxicola]|uniref:Adenine phosphoribosyltransferase n=1 Tax=Sandaracinobacteroides saxicola TaxID=2759707 RepID=A0A7G5IKH0_9SPHN|nr:adenine phosphoribosyltransferase [Sandaracinobacteroides saxicola]QMW23862.1 adenine phosphoribosyltransferase [Sandaracinobacteroides saxicola]